MQRSFDICSEVLSDPFDPVHQLGQLGWVEHNAPARAPFIEMFEIVQAQSDRMAMAVAMGDEGAATPPDQYAHEALAFYQQDNRGHFLTHSDGLILLLSMIASRDGTKVGEFGVDALHGGTNLLCLIGELSDTPEDASFALPGDTVRWFPGGEGSRISPEIRIYQGDAPKASALQRNVMIYPKLGVFQRLSGGQPLRRVIQSQTTITLGPPVPDHSYTGQP